MDRGLVGTEGNEDNDGREDQTAGQRTTGLSVNGPHGSIGLWLKKNVTSSKFRH